MKPKRVLAINTPWLLQCTICSSLRDVDFHYDSWDWKMAQKGSCFILSYAFLLRNFLRLPASLRLPFRSHTFAILDFSFSLALPFVGNSRGKAQLRTRKKWFLAGEPCPTLDLKASPAEAGAIALQTNKNFFLLFFASLFVVENIKAEFLWYRFVRAFYGHFKGAL